MGITDVEWESDRELIRAGSTSGFFGPVLRWELVTIPRRLRYFLVRALYALVLLGTLWMTHEGSFWQNRVYGGGHTTSIQQMAAFASAFFESYLWVQTAAVLLLTPAFVASGIAMEKERRTIEYLFASDLSNREIVLGKLLARTLNLIVILLAGVPIAAFAGLFGGVDYLGLLLLTLGSMAMLLSVAGLSILVSIYSRTTRQALTTTYTILAFVLISPLMVMFVVSMVGTVLDYFSPATSDAFEKVLMSQAAQMVFGGLMAMHPFAIALQLSSPMATLWGTAGGEIWVGLIYVGGHLLLAMLFVSVAILRLRRVHQYEAGASSKAAASREKIRRRFRLPRGQVWEQWPLAWKEIHAGSYRSLGCLARILVVFVAFAFYVSVLWNLRDIVDDQGELNMLVRTGTTMFAVLAYLFVAFRSATCIGQERDRDCWTSLLSTPVTAQEVIVSKWFGSLAPVVQVILFLSPLWFLALVNHELSGFGVMMLILALFIFGGALASLGVYQSLCRRTTLQAIAATLGIAVFVGGLGQMFLIPLAFGASHSAMVIGASVPWVVIFSAAHFSRGFLDIRSFDVEFLGCCVVSGICYGVVGLVLLGSAIARFGEVTGRSEGKFRPAGLRPSPGPPPLLAAGASGPAEPNRTSEPGDSA